MDSRNAIQTPNHGRRGMHARQGSPESLSRFFYLGGAVVSSPGS